MIVVITEGCSEVACVLFEDAAGSGTGLEGDNCVLGPEGVAG